ncbi:FecR family protein [Pedobacter nyackensis]|uniref:FecR family protein n=1 Tax=Pedobacter nyackensis TaxID=475255 RepID=UPI0029318085|nr:FecR domain-containing protein [Pedobacter nyackensis]
MSLNKAEELIKKYLAGNCSEAERSIVESWHLQDIKESSVSVSNEKIEEVSRRMRIHLLAHTEKGGTGMLKPDGKSEFESDANQSVPADSNYSLGSIIFTWPRLAAASIILAISFGIFFYKSDIGTSSPSNSVVVTDISAVGNKAILTLADGRSINLKEDQNGIVVGTEKVTYTDGTDIVGAEKSGDKSAHTLLALSTPKGAQYQITLSDGTKIWLNSHSRIRYPLAFEKTRRSIEVLDGEVYLEVVHKPEAPFHVFAKGQEIEVLGTSFNVNTYSAVKTITTLIKGSVKVKNMQGDKHLILTPGEESVMEKDNLFKQPADLNVVTAWKENYFYFKNEPLENVMMQISQWYGVSIKYDNSFKKVRIGGFISRNNSLKTLLELLEETGNFSLKLQDSTVVVKNRN